MVSTCTSQLYVAVWCSVCTQDLQTVAAAAWLTTVRSIARYITSYHIAIYMVILEWDIVANLTNGKPFYFPLQLVQIDPFTMIPLNFPTQLLYMVKLYQIQEEVYSVCIHQNTYTYFSSMLLHRIPYSQVGNF